MSEIGVRPARRDDFELALRLYMETNAPLLARLGFKDRGDIIDRFRRNFRLSQVRMIHHKGSDIGWLQVSETSAGIHLHQIFIVESMRNRGIGTAFIKGILDRARKHGRSVTLNVIRGNRAISLYRRLGFTLGGEIDGRLRMRWSTHATGRTGGRT